MNIYYIAGYPISDELYHHGILGQKWGVRRYQNADGTLTEAGKRHYAKVEARRYKTEQKNARHIESGKTLLDKNRTKIGAVGRTVGRQIGISAVATIGTAALTGILVSKAVKINLDNNNADPAVAKLISDRILIGKTAISAAALGLTVANISKGYRNVRDISKAEGAGYKKRKDRLPGE